MAVESQRHCQQHEKKKKKCTKTKEHKKNNGSRAKSCLSHMTPNKTQIIVQQRKTGKCVLLTIYSHSLDLISPPSKFYHQRCSIPLAQNCCTANKWTAHEPSSRQWPSMNCWHESCDGGGGGRPVNTPGWNMGALQTRLLQGNKWTCPLSKWLTKGTHEHRTGGNDGSI